ncbi:MAG: signal transduction histidine kinase, partial [Granulosicoccus sp.]
SEQWALIYQRDNKSRKLDLLRLLKAQVPLAEVMVSAKAPLAELEVDQVALFLLTHPEDGSRFFSEINLAGEGTNTPYAQPVIPLSFFEPVSSGNYSLICTLEFDDEHFGYMVASCAPDAAEFIEVIGVQLSEVLHADALVRTSEHYRQLNEMNARMASLGSLVSGVAHEINTPIGTGKLAASSLLTATHALQAQISNNSMTRSNFDAYLTDAIEYAEIIFQSLSRAANLISNFKLVSVDQTGEAKRIFDLGDYLTSVLVSLRHQLKGTQVELITDFESGIVVDTYPGAVAQVVTNLFMNALAHGFDDGELAGTIEMRLKKTRSGFELSTQDNGKGANAAIVKQIFDPFFTTTRGKGGSGLGMHIVYNLLSQKLFWTIEVQSAQGNGFRALLKPAARHQSFEASAVDPIEPNS